MNISTDDAYLSFVATGFYVIAAAIAFRLYAKRRSKTMFLFAMTWIFNALNVLSGGISQMYLDPLLFKIQYAVFFPLGFIAWMAFLDYAQSDGIGWKKMVIAVGYSMLLITWVMRPENEITFTQFGSVIVIDIPYEFAFLMITDVYTILYAGTVVYWARVSLKASPATMKKPILMIFLVSIPMLIGACSLVLVDLSAAGVDILDADTSSIIAIITVLFVLVNSIVMAIAISKEPRIVHFLPYRVYQLVVTAKTGTPYYSYKWSEEEIEVNMSAGLLSAITSFTKETLKNVKSGGISTIQMDRAVMITRLQYSPVNIALIASKSSQDLQQNLTGFSEDFVKTYYNSLYDKDGFPRTIGPAEINNVIKESDMEKMVLTHFANIPSYLVKPVDPIADASGKNKKE
jgi:hypothetical protein